MLLKAAAQQLGLTLASGACLEMTDKCVKVRHQLNELLTRIMGIAAATRMPTICANLAVYGLHGIPQMGRE